MLKHFKSLLLLVPLFALSSQAIAHPGHDHSHWFSDINHALFFIAIIGAIGTAALITRKIREKAGKKS